MSNRNDMIKTEKHLMTIPLEWVKEDRFKKRFLRIECEGWNYFYAYIDPHLGIYKARPDGTELTLLQETGKVESFEMKDGWLYFSDISPATEAERNAWGFERYRIHRTCKMKPDGTELTELEYSWNGSKVIKHDGWLFFIDRIDKNGGIYKIRRDGSDLTLIYQNGDARNLELKDGWLYCTDTYEYSVLDGMLYDRYTDVTTYKIRPDGTGLMKESSSTRYNSSSN